jgi:hypothetical protein
VTLRQPGIGEREDRNDCIGRRTADGACRYEGGRMLQCQDDIGRTRGGRERGDQRADEGAAALDRNRGSHHDRGRERHLQRELIPEQELSRYHALPCS